VSGARDLALALSFVECINRADVDGLRALMSDDHELCVFDEPPLCGRDENVAAWRGYATSFPNYTIYVDQTAARDGRVALLGSTTGSHLGLPDDEERLLTLIWIADIEPDARTLRRWQLVPDTAEWRHRLGLGATAEPSL
jgi:hypothetical protein